MKRVVLSLLFICSSIFLFATDYFVTTTSDSGPGSLREAITQANTSSVGIDNIIFAIDLSDPNYNATTGVFTISLLADLPMIMSANITIDGNSQQSTSGDTNPNGPEIEIVSGADLEYCFRIVAPNNNFRNLVISGFEFGTQIYGSMANNINIEENYLGTTYNGLMISPNEYGIGISGNATNITISNNLISGNTLAGIVCSEANNITIIANKIGTDISGTIPLANPTGIMLENSYGITIGGDSESERNLISGNTDGGILIYDLESINNTVTGNYIGTDITGTDTIPNGNGVMLISSAFNTIGGSTIAERNIISGNTGCGILINGTGANNNLVVGNYVGTDITGDAALSNHYGVIIKADADKNIVGGDTPEERNVISANWEIGVYIEASDSNKVSGNFIGTNYLGTEAFYINGDSLIQANGVEINTVSKYNIIGGETEGERNIISGNRVYGAIYYGQVSENNIAGNYIGTDVTGSFAIPNATGICVDDASNNNIMENNLLSGNISYGLFIVTTGSNANVFRGNFVGTNADASDSIPNDVGLLIGGGAKSNIIGGYNVEDRNIFSGNRYGGIELSDNGTDYNKIIGNFIGTDISGNDSISNGFGIGVSSLVTGTIIENNVISGNKTFGLVLTENSDSTTVILNKIGIGFDESTDLGNSASGIAITQGSNTNFIGNPENSNIIAYNDSLGIVIMDVSSVNNKISGNSIYENEYLGIDLFPAGPNANDAGDADNGPNSLLNYPVITDNWFDTDSWTSFIEGTLDTENTENCTVELFASESYAPFTIGQGKHYIATAYPDETGYWIAQCTDGVGGEKITAVTIDEYGNTSEFSENFDHYTDVKNGNYDNSNFSVFPNPVNEYFTVKIPTSSLIRLDLYDYTGRLILHLFVGKPNTDNLQFNINELGLNSGIYFIHLSEESSQTKIIKLSIIN